MDILHKKMTTECHRNVSFVIRIFALTLGTSFDSNKLGTNMLAKGSKNSPYDLSRMFSSENGTSIGSPLISPSSLAIAIQGNINDWIFININYTSEASFSTVPLRRPTLENEKCPSLLGCRALNCSERGDRTLDLRVMNPTLLPTELPRQALIFQ
jgi:hypothetical protein